MPIKASEYLKRLLEDVSEVFWWAPPSLVAEAELAAAEVLLAEQAADGEVGDPALAEGQIETDPAVVDGEAGAAPEEPDGEDHGQDARATQLTALRARAAELAAECEARKVAFRFRSVPDSRQNALKDQMELAKERWLSNAEYRDTVRTALLNAMGEGTVEDIADYILGLAGMPEEWSAGADIKTPCELLQIAADKVREGLEAVKVCGGVVLAGQAEDLIEGIEIQAAATDWREWVSGLPVRLGETESGELAALEDGGDDEGQRIHERLEEVFARLRGVEIEARRAIREEHRTRLIGEGREELLKRATRQGMMSRADDEAVGWYLKTWITESAEVPAAELEDGQPDLGGLWLKAFETPEQVDQLAGTQDPDGQALYQWMRLKVAERMPQNEAELVGTLPFRGAVGALSG